MKKTIKGCTHHETKVVGKFAGGGSVGHGGERQNNANQGGSSSGRSGGNWGSGGGNSGRNNAGNRQNEAVQPGSRSYNNTWGQSRAADVRSGAAGTPAAPPKPMARPVKVVPAAAPIPPKPKLKPAIRPDATLAAFQPWWKDPVKLGRPNPYTGPTYGGTASTNISKTPKGAGQTKRYYDRVPQGGK